MSKGKILDRVIIKKVFRGIVIIVWMSLPIHHPINRLAAYF